jgi:rare lipoprotein A
MKHALVAALVLTVAVAGCARKKQVRAVAPSPVPTAGWSETGVASWYGHPYHGRQAASGEIYDMEKLTAAHRTLPFHTWVLVEDLDNGKSVEVRINDRGPFVDGRIIDLSHAAARDIQMIGPGTAKVRIQVIRTAAPRGPAVFAVQIGAFQDEKNARRVREKMESSFGAARLVRRDGSPVMWRVLVGAESKEDAAEALAGRIRGQDSAWHAAFVVRLDL